MPDAEAGGPVDVKAHLHWGLDIEGFSDGGGFDRETHSAHCAPITTRSIEDGKLRRSNKAQGNSIRSNIGLPVTINEPMSSAL